MVAKKMPMKMPMPPQTKGVRAGGLNKPLPAKASPTATTYRGVGKRK